MTGRMKTFVAVALVVGMVFAAGAAVAQPPRGDNVPTIKMGPQPTPQSLVTILQAMRDRLLGWPNLTYGSGSPGLLRVAELFDYTINGVVYQKSVADNIASSISGSAVSATQESIFRVEMNSSGTVATVQGPIVTNSDCGSAIATLPQRSASKVTLGWVRVCRYSGGFTPGTSTLNNAAVTINMGDPDLTESLLATP